MALISRPTSPGELEEQLNRAWATRRQHFADEVVFSAPSFKHYRNAELQASGHPRFVALSVTGRQCALSCDHCRGVLLEAMVPVPTPSQLLQTARQLAARGCRGLLVSGGCTSGGRVPLDDFFDVLPRLRAELGLTLAVHPGLVDRDIARRLRDCGVDRVMVDLVGDPATAREVLHLAAEPADFERSLGHLVEAGLAVVPHIVVGLHRGRLRGEYQALAMAARHQVAATVLVVVRPEPATPFRHIPIPDPDEVALLMARARLSLERAPLFLGCARPVGLPSRILEQHAIRSGFNGVAFPADETVRLATSLGLRATFVEQCCALEAP